MYSHVTHMVVAAVDETATVFHAHSISRDFFSLYDLLLRILYISEHILQPFLAYDSCLLPSFEYKCLMHGIFSPHSGEILVKIIPPNVIAINDVLN